MSPNYVSVEPLFILLLCLLFSLFHFLVFVFSPLLCFLLLFFVFPSPRTRNTDELRRRVAQPLATRRLPGCVLRVFLVSAQHRVTPLKRRHQCGLVGPGTSINSVKITYSSLVTTHAHISLSPFRASVSTHPSSSWAEQLTET